MASISFLVGGLLLSPDLDTRSNPTHRWGPLRLLWWPYRRLLSHRSLLSHSPLLGTTGRLLYLISIVMVICLLARPLGAPTAAQLTLSAHQLWQSSSNQVIAALAGLEASAWLHLIQDGDPEPRLPRLLRRRANRRKQRKRQRH